MEHHMRAEYAEGDTPGDPEAPVRKWHMVRGAEEPRTLCGLLLDPAAATQPADAWGTSAARPFCKTCGALYLREVP
ncbi:MULTISPECIES: hypothetical protein [unclassified Streptomyces]|uniref:hypothetical protein n=1 Tax=unclassified Streptomyces TaxID=2593676 RepID=UPI0004C8544B|nr:hypothetical protein [Streptomyces sp. NRRL F-5630]